MNKIHGIAFVILSLVLSCGFVFISSTRNLTSLENSLFQVFTLIAGLSGSYILGKEASKQAALDMIRPHAKSAFRRVLSLYSSLSRLVQEIQSSKTRFADDQNALDALDKFKALVVEQIFTSNDAIEDWNDIIPEEVAKIRAIAERQRGPGDIYDERSS